MFSCVCVSVRMPVCLSVCLSILLAIWLLLSLENPFHLMRHSEVTRISAHYLMHWHIHVLFCNYNYEDIRVLNCIEISLTGERAGIKNIAPVQVYARGDTSGGFSLHGVNQLMMLNKGLAYQVDKNISCSLYVWCEIKFDSLVIVRIIKENNGGGRIRNSYVGARIFRRFATVFPTSNVKLIGN